MKKKLIALLCITLFYSPFLVNAAITEAEIEDYLSPIGWTTTDLEDYLEIFDMSLDDFETLAELKEFVGTPITAENLAALFARINMSQEEAEALLNQYYDSIEEYFFIEDLEEAIEFYLEYGEDLAEIEDLYAKIGITDEELEKLFLHLSQLDEQELEQKMEAIAQRLMHIGDFSNFEEMTEDQKSELASIWTDMLGALKLQVRLYLTDQDMKQEISITELINLTSFNGKRLLVEIYNDHNMLLLDMSLSEEMFDSEFFSLFAETYETVAELANEHPYGEKMPKTASNFLLITLLGLIITFVSGLALVMLQTRARHSD